MTMTQDRTGDRTGDRKAHSRSFRHVSDEQLLADRSSMTLAEMASKYGVDRSTVSVRLKHLGQGTRARPRYDDLIPWRVRVSHDQAEQIYHLRLLARYRAGTLPEHRLGGLRRWLQWCVDQNVVVSYDNDQGFGYTECTSSAHPYYEDALVELKEWVLRSSSHSDQAQPTGSQTGG